MLRALAESKLPANFLVIEDREDAAGHDLFTAFLANHLADETTGNIKLICYENPPRFYLSEDEMPARVSSEFFSDPRGWNDESAKYSPELFLCDSKDLSATVFFIDSLSCLVEYVGFNTAYRVLHYLKKNSKKVVCLTHGDLLTPEWLEELQHLSTGYLRFLDGTRTDGRRVMDVIYKKPHGKVPKQREVFSVSGEFKVSSKVEDQTQVVKESSDVKEKIGSLTTFKLDFDMSENERRAKEKLVLPYLRRGGCGDGAGAVIYEPEADELEEDPDDDLDI